MALSRDIVIRLVGDAESAVRAQKAAADAAGVNVAAYRRAEREYARTQQAMETASRKQSEAMERVGRGTMIFGAVVAAGLAVAAKAAVDWESAWAGVMKTVDGSPAQMAELEGSLRNLATQLPATHAEIAGVAEAAGQLGIARGSIVEFTKVAIAMGVSTNLSAEDAATGLARLSNIMGTSSNDVDRMGSALVALGNAGASTEGEILDMSLRIAAAGRQAGFTEGEVMGLANAMSSLGIEAEAGGTAISTVIKKINNAVLDGGQDLETYARIAGKTVAEFSAAWREDAAGALVLVVEGLGRMQAQGENVNTVINDLGLGGIRTSDTLLRLAGNADGLADSLALGNEAWAENSALMNEANQRYETTASRIALARNQIIDAAIDIGGTLLPVVAEGAEILANLARGFQELPGPLRNVAAVLGLAAGSIGLVGGAAISAAPKIAAFRATMQTLEASSSGVQRNMGRFGLFMTGPWGAALGVATFAIGGLIAALGASSRASEEAAAYQRDLASALRETGGVIDDNIREMAALQAEESKVADRSLLEWARDLGVALPTVTDALLGQRDAYDEIVGAIEGAMAAEQARAAALQGAGGAEAQQIQNRIANYQSLLDTFHELAGGMGGAVAENERLAAASEESGNAAQAAGQQVDGAAEAARDFGAEASDAAKAVDNLVSALQSLTGTTVTMYEAEVALGDALRDADGALEGLDGTVLNADGTLNRYSESGSKVFDVLMGVRDAGDRLIATMIQQGRTSQEVQARDAELRASFVRTAMQMGIGENAANDLADAILGVPAERETRIDTDVRNAMANVDALQSNIENTHGKEVVISVRAAGRFVINPNGGLQEFWSGGYTGPGGKFEPKGVVHGGEVVWSQDDVAAHGGPQRVDSMRRSRGPLPGFAHGGIVPLTLEHDTRPVEQTMAEVAEAMKNAIPKAPPISGGSGQWQSMFNAVKAVFPHVVLNSGFRPGSITATGNLSYHALGRAIDITPDMNIFNWLASNYRNSRELIFSPAGIRQIWNGAPHYYSEPTRGDHWNHIHWAMANGGVIREPILGMGMRTGASYAFGERGPETVTPGVGGGVPAVVIDYDRLARAVGGRTTSISVTAPADQRGIARAVVDAQRDMEFLHG